MKSLKKCTPTFQRSNSFPGQNEKVGIRGGIKVHEFHEKLEQSHIDSPLLERHYQGWFCDVGLIHRIPKDGHAQRSGIDTYVIQEAGKIINTDEKIRDEDYGDILLEYWSNYERRTLGWIMKEQNNEYISYYVKSSDKGFLLPTAVVQKTFRINAKKWHKIYPTIKAKNKGYITHSLAIPVDILYEAMTDVMISSRKKPL